MNIEISLKARVFLSSIWVLFLQEVTAIEPIDSAVLIDSAISKNPATITLTWLKPKESVEKYTVSRKDKYSSTWTELETLSGNETNFRDTRIDVGKTYEYQVEKTGLNYKGFGYIVAGIEIPLVEKRGKVLLIIEETLNKALQFELDRLVDDLVGDGFEVLTITVSSSENVIQVKDRIRKIYRKNPYDLKYIFLIGHVPVPYSGKMAPDGHSTDHLGAWPADAYYADMDEIWTDAIINSSSISNERNRNIPNDGRFDQNRIPSLLKIAVGRVDFLDLPICAVPEVELTRLYLNKNHRFRHGQFETERCGVIADLLGFANGEATAANGWRNLASLFGASRVEVANLDYLRAVKEKNYLFGYACGFGTYSSLAGVATSEDFVNGGANPIFTMFFGSYFGDFDTTDNLMRAVLASNLGGLTCSWSGRPNWFYHHMGLGETVGYSLLVSQNNWTTYRTQNYGANGTHVTLLGDPTLRLHQVKSGYNLHARGCRKGVNLSWNESKDIVIGYNIYRKDNPAESFKRLNRTPVTSNYYLDENIGFGDYIYQIRALKLETGNSGSYFNQSQGVYIQVAKKHYRRLK